MLTTRMRTSLIHVFMVSLACFCFSQTAAACRKFDNLQQLDAYDIDIVALSELYPLPSDRIWTKNQQLTVKANEALQFIAQSAEHGLKPNDYHQNLLILLDPTHCEANANVFELVLSDGLMKLISDISIGRLDPLSVDADWSIPRAPFDTVNFLKQALAASHIREHLASLAPKSTEYRQLQAAVSRYQQYVEQGGWSKIPSSPLLRRGDFSPNIQAIRHRLAFEDDTLNDVRPIYFDYYDEHLERVVHHFQRHHSLKADGIIGPETIRAMNISAENRLQQIKINLERLRWLPDDLGRRYIMVNLANYQLIAVEDDDIKLNMRVIVGNTERQTPSFNSQMTQVVFNPNWYIPHRVASQDLLPKQQANPDYFERYSIRVSKKQGDGSNIEIDPASVNWNMLTQDNFPYTLKQDPGNNNALGRLKFVLKNEWRIYLHDTPSKGLFNRQHRNFSSGCIRVEDPLALARFSLNGHTLDRSLPDMINSDETYSAELGQPLSVYAIYATAWIDGGELIFSPDNYHRDQKMAEYL